MNKKNGEAWGQGYIALDPGLLLPTWKIFAPSPTESWKCVLL